jgi:hypothetical protein
MLHAVKRAGLGADDSVLVAVRTLKPFSLADPPAGIERGLYAAGVVLTVPADTAAILKVAGLARLEEPGAASANS